ADSVGVAGVGNAVGDTGNGVGIRVEDFVAVTRHLVLVGVVYQIAATGDRVGVAVAIQLVVGTTASVGVAGVGNAVGDTGYGVGIRVEDFVVVTPDEHPVAA